MILEKETIKLPYGLKAIFTKRKHIYKCSGNERVFINCDIKQGNTLIDMYSKMVEENGKKVKALWM